MPEASQFPSSIIIQYLTRTFHLFLFPSLHAMYQTLDIFICSSLVIALQRTPRPYDHFVTLQRHSFEYELSFFISIL